MKISIDYDGTMWSHMNFFRQLMISMKAAGHSVGCLTGHEPRIRDSDISLMLSRGFPEPDFWFGRTPEYVPFNGAKFKSAMILQEGIDIHFDDFDYNNPETERLFKECLGDEFYRIVKVQHREPHTTHYE